MGASKLHWGCKEKNRDQFDGCIEITQGCKEKRKQSLLLTLFQRFDERILLTLFQRFVAQRKITPAMSFSSVSIPKTDSATVVVAQTLEIFSTYSMLPSDRLEPGFELTRDTTRINSSSDTKITGLNSSQSIVHSYSNVPPQKMNHPQETKSWLWCSPK